MNGYRLYHIDQCRLKQLGQLRSQTGIEIGVDSDHIWMRIDETNSHLREAILRCLPDAREFEPTAEDLLVQSGYRLPSEKVPALEWITIQQAIPVAAPLAHYPASRVSRVPLSFCRHSEFHPGNGLLTSLAQLKIWSQRVPETLFAGCNYAVNGNAMAIVLGEQLPAVDGVYLVERDRLIIPAGWSWSPAFQPLELHRLLTDDKRDYLFFQPEEMPDCFRIPEDHFVPLTRSSLQATSREMSRAE